MAGPFEEDAAYRRASPMRSRLAAPAGARTSAGGLPGRLVGRCQDCAPASVLSARAASTFVDVPGRWRRSTVRTCPGSRWSWAALARPATASDDTAPSRPDRQPGRARAGRRRCWPSSGRSRWVPCSSAPSCTTTPTPVRRPGRRRRQRGRAGLPVAVVAAAVAASASRCVCLLAGTISTSATPAGSPGAVVPGGAPPRPGHRAWSPCCGSRRSCLRRLQPDHRPRRRRAVRHAAGARRERLGHVHPGPPAAAAVACASERCGPRPTRSCTRSRPGWPNGRASRARCTTSWRTGSR